VAKNFAHDDIRAIHLTGYPFQVELTVFAKIKLDVVGDKFQQTRL
jgi:hypothetical protein